MKTIKEVESLIILAIYFVWSPFIYLFKSKEDWEHHKNEIKWEWQSFLEV